MNCLQTEAKKCNPIQSGTKKHVQNLRKFTMNVNSILTS